MKLLYKALPEKLEFVFYMTVVFLTRIVVSVPLLIPTHFTPQTTKLFGVTVPSYFVEHGTYFGWIATINMLQREFGVFKVWTPYPPLYSVFIYALFLVARNNFNVAWDLWFLLNALSDCGTATLLWKIVYTNWAKKIGFEGAYYALQLYSVSPLPIFYVLSASVYDPQIVFLFVLGYYLLKRSKFVASAFVCALGASLKLFPALIFLALLASKEKRKLLFTIYFVVFVLLLNLPFYFISPSFFLSPFYWQAGRPPWSSIYGLVLGGSIGAYQISSPIYADLSPPVIPVKWDYYVLGIVPSPSVLVKPLAPQPERPYSAVPQIAEILVLGITFALLSKRKSAFENSLLSITSAFFLISPGWSPEFFLYELPILAIALNPESYFKTSVFAQILLLVEYPISLFVLPPVVNIQIFWTAVILQDALFGYLWLKPFIHHTESL